MQKVRVCLVIPSLQAGGMERVMSELARHFCRKPDLEIHMILYGKEPEIFFALPENLILHVPPSFNEKLKFFSAIGRLLYLRTQIKKINPDTILSFGEIWNSFVLLAMTGLSYPVFISDRCSPVKDFSFFHSLLRKILYPKAKGIIAQTQKSSDVYFHRFNLNNIKVIGNPIREISGKDGSVKENIVLMVGRLIRSKNQDKLIDLFLKINLPGWKLVLVGYDHLKQNNSQRMLEIIKRNQAEDRVVLTGRQSDVDKFYLKSKIFAFTSESEGFPNAIGEAMSAGLPVIAFDCIAGPSDLIDDNSNGFLIPLFNYDMFMEKLEILMKNEEFRFSYGNNGKIKIKEYSIEKISDKYLQFILNHN